TSFAAACRQCRACAVRCRAGRSMRSSMSPPTSGERLADKRCLIRPASAGPLWKRLTLTWYRDRRSGPRDTCGCRTPPVASNSRADLTGWRHGFGEKKIPNPKSETEGVIRIWDFLPSDFRCEGDVMGVLLLSENDVLQLLTMDDALEVVEQ